jgi:hypothetical protein
MTLSDEWVTALGQIERDLAALRGVDASGVPLVTIADLLVVVDAWTTALGEFAEREGATLKHWRPSWGRVVDAVGGAGIAQRALDDRYPDPARVFGALRWLAADLDRSRAIVAGIGESLRAGWRNATVTVQGDEVRIADVKDWVDLWSAFVSHYKAQRGTVDEPTPPSNRAPRKYPNTTAGEVLGLADFWTARIDELGARRVDAAAAITAWASVVTRTVAAASGKPATDPFPENWAFWDALREFVAAIDQARDHSVQPEWRVYLDVNRHHAQEEAAKVNAAATKTNAVAASHHAAQAAGEVATAVAESAKAAIHGAEAGLDKATKQGTGSTDAPGGKDLTTPLLVGGVLVLGALVAIPLLVRD